MSRARELVATLGLAPHPEGGWYRETFRSDLPVVPADDRGTRAALTAIWYLLEAGQRSRWHRVRSDEVWQHVEGDGLELVVADPALRESRTIVLAALADGGTPVHVVPAGWWQAARPRGAHALAGCVVGPGFDFADFEFLAGTAAEATLRARWPALAELL